jgi:hypothetical protein
MEAIGERVFAFPVRRRLRAKEISPPIKMKMFRCLELTLPKNNIRFHLNKFMQVTANVGDFAANKFPILNISAHH